MLALIRSDDNVDRPLEMCVAPISVTTVKRKNSSVPGVIVKECKILNFYLLESQASCFFGNQEVWNHIGIIKIHRCFNGNVCGNWLIKKIGGKVL